MTIKFRRNQIQFNIPTKHSEEPRVQSEPYINFHYIYAKLSLLAGVHLRRSRRSGSKNHSQMVSKLYTFQVNCPKSRQEIIVQNA